MAETATKALAVIGAGAIAVLIAKTAANKAIENIHYSVGAPQLDLSDFQGGFINVNLPVTITNNNPFNINIKSFFGVVKYGEITLSNVSFPVGFILQSGVTKTITLELHIPVNVVLNDVLTQIQNGNIFNTIFNKIYLSGVVNIRTDITSLNIPIDQLAIPIV